MGLSTNQALAALGILVVGLVIGTGGIQVDFSGITGGSGPAASSGSGCIFAAPEDVSSENCGDKADTSVRVFDQVANSKTQVNAEVKSWQITKTNGEKDKTYLGSTKTSSSGGTTISTNYGAKMKYVAFNGTYDYAQVKEVVVTRDGQNVELKTYTGATTSDLTATIRNDETGSSTTSDTLSGDQQEDYNIELELSSSNLAYNPAAVCFRHSDTTDDNITSVNLANAQSVDVPSRVSSYDSCYKFGDGMHSKKPTQMEFDTVEGKMVVQADSDGTGANDQIDIAYLDWAPYISQSNDLAFGLQDDQDTASDVGVSDKTDTLDFS